MGRKGGSIFERGLLTAVQLRTVADRRFDDARYLADSRTNKYANGAMYLAGFVVEVLEQEARARLQRQLKDVCAEWTIYARYSPRQATIAEAEKFLGKIKEIRPWLR